MKMNRNLLGGFLVVCLFAVCFVCMPNRYGKAGDEKTPVKNDEIVIAQPSQADVKKAKAMADGFFEELCGDQAKMELAIHDLTLGVKLERHNVSQIARQLVTLKQQFPKAIPELVKVKNFGEDCIVLQYMHKTQAAPQLFCFIFFRSLDTTGSPGTQWFCYNVQFSYDYVPVLLTGM